MAALLPVDGCDEGKGKGARLVEAQEDLGVGGDAEPQADVGIGRVAGGLDADGKRGMGRCRFHGILGFFLPFHLVDVTGP